MKSQLDFRLWAITFALFIFLKEDKFLLALLFFFNFIVVNYGGVTAIRALVFPFSVAAIRIGVDSSNVVRY